MEVHDELMEKLENQDGPALGAKGRKDSLCTPADQSAQRCFAPVDKHARATAVGAEKFMADTDAWIVSPAMAELEASSVTQHNVAVGS